MAASLSGSDAAALDGVGRQPRVSVTVNGVPVSEVISILVHRNNFLAADTFKVVFAFDPGAGVPDWVQADVVALDLMIAENPGTSLSVITGLADEVVLDLANGIVTATGRDYTAQFIETKTAEKFQNLTSSQVVQILANRHGLASQVTSTMTPTGKYYDSDHSIVTNEVSEWTLLSYLAGREGFDIFVQGNTLFFQPAANPIEDSPFDVYCVVDGSSPSANVSRLITHRSMTLARDVIVKVVSWNHEMKSAVTATRRAEKTTARGQSAKFPPTTYVFREAGLTQDQANALADSKLRELTLHERRIEFDIPGDLSLTPRSLVRLSGTGTDFDQTYFVAQIYITCSLERGFSMKVTAKNASPQSVANI